MPSRKVKPTKTAAPKAAPQKATLRKGLIVRRPQAAKKASPLASPAPQKEEGAAKDMVSPQPLSLREQKNAIRREIRASLQKMRERNRRSKSIVEAIISHPVWRRSTIVAMFAPMDHEPDVELLWSYAKGKTLCYPMIRLGGIDFIGVGGPESLAIGQFGIREPVFDQAHVMPPDTFDLVLVPGSAFTANGERLGRGGGFYDRLLSSPGFCAFKAGVCFDRQILPSVPMEPHDQKVHRVVTESGWVQRPDFAK